MIPDTNENLYELGWQVRHVLFDQLIDQGVNDIYELLVRFDAVEHSHEFKFKTEKIQAGAPNTEEGSYLTGDIEVVSRGNPDQKQFSLNQLIHPLQPLTPLFLDDVDTIVELGCGYGRNLFLLDLLLGQPKVNYIAAEYTNSGQELAKKLASKFLPAMNFQTEFIDHKDPDFSFLGNSKKALVFSCHSIEQVANIPQDYFSKLANCGPEIIGAHLEPFGFQTKEQDQQTNKHHQFALLKSYNLNFYDVLKATEARNELNIQYLRTDMFFTQPENPTSVVFWNNNMKPTA